MPKKAFIFQKMFLWWEVIENNLTSIGVWWRHYLSKYIYIFRENTNIDVIVLEHILLIRYDIEHLKITIFHEENSKNNF